MTRKSLLLAALIGVTALPSAALSAADGGKTTLCHRTGQQPRDGLFAGQVLNVSTNAVANHLENHGDLLANAGARAKLRQGEGCFIDANGALYNGAGHLLQPAPGSSMPGAPPPSGPPPGEGPG